MYMYLFLAAACPQFMLQTETLSLSVWPCLSLCGFFVLSCPLPSMWLCGELGKGGEGAAGSVHTERKLSDCGQAEWLYCDVI